ncbi:hypothetical protein MPLA_70021 [Mesorhizobium sp. ORS 3359]|nr:hypothetical protein MPLA_70021 [Mesorhizobium sp. ORS 3359]
MLLTRLSVTCILIVSHENGCQDEFRNAPVPYRAQPRRGRRVVEHPVVARRLSGPDALRPVPEEP